MIAALLVPFLQAVQAPGAHAPEAGPRAPLAGLDGFQTVSRIDFGAQQNRLTAVYVFPDRARWHFESYGAVQRSEHQYFYRTGDHVRTLATGSGAGELGGEARTLVLLQMELRRAVMLWPDGFEWEPREDGTRAAAVRTDTCCRGPVIGSLVATLADGRPTRIEARDEKGAPREAFVISAWQERHGRTWPRTLVLEGQGGGFSETVESIETGVHLLELSFVPPPLRPAPETEPGPAPFARDLVAMTYAARAVPDGLGWDAALDLARRWIDEVGPAVAPLGLAVDPVPTFEVSPAGRPVRCLVRLTTAARPPPAGHETREERAGLCLALTGLAAVDANLLRRLGRGVPAGARAGTPYVRIHARKDLPIELVLPLEPGE